MAQAGPVARATGTRRDHTFHRLLVADVVAETADATTFALDVPDELRATFAYAAGQFCNFRVEIDGEPYVRCYSMSSCPDVDDDLRVTVKRVPGGAVSNWMNDVLRAGDAIDVAPPTGFFQLTDATGDVVAFAGGSGITPVFSLLKATLATTARRVRLLYANRDRGAVIFRHDLDELVAAHPGRLSVVHHLDDEAGFVDDADVRAVITGARDPSCYVCGPDPFMEVVERVLLDEGVAATDIHIERFSSADPLPPSAGGPRTEQAADDRPCVVTIDLEGRIGSVEHRPGTTILQTARQMGLSPPFSCESGSCATCMARVVDGAVSMYVNNALTPGEVDEGWVLTCQSVPTTPTVRVVYGYD